MRMIENIRWLLENDGTKTLQAYDGYVWFDIETVNKRKD